MPQLTVIKGGRPSGSPFIFDHERDPIVTIGRHGSNDIVIKDPRRKISRHHAALILNTDNEYFIQDLGSVNGVEINDQVVFQGLVNDGDTIRVGNAYLTFAAKHKRPSRLQVPVIPEKEARQQQQEAHDQTELRTEVHINTNSLLDGLNENMRGVFVDISKRLQMLSDRERIVQDVLDSICHATGAGQGYAALTEGGGMLWVTNTFGIDVERGDTIPGLAQTWIDQVLEEERPCHMKNLQGSGEAFICAPLWRGLSLIGLIYVGGKEKGFRDEDINFITLVADSAREALKNATEHDPDDTLEEIQNFRWQASMIGNTKTKAMKKVYQAVDALGRQNANILLLGETGSGKEITARSIHNVSSRRENPFVAIELSALPSDEMVASELFGHVKGSFTGAESDKKGRFEMADSGSLFLDEIGDISLETQAKLRRAIENKEIAKVGEAATLTVDTRIISATNRDLDGMIAAGEFKDDLLERLGQVIELPPLRERKEDIPLLAHYFIAEAETSVKGVSPKAMQLLLDYEWHRNIRELRNTIEEAVAKAGGKDLLYPWDLPEKLQREEGTGKVKKAASSLKESEYKSIVKALEQTDWNVSQAAELLGVSRQTLYNKIKNNRIRRPK